MLIKYYNYANKEFFAHDAHNEEDISTIIVNVISGDEIIVICWKDGAEARFDAGSNDRFMDFCAGQYIIKDKEKIHKWLNWTGTNDRTYSYARMEEFA